MTKRVYTQTFGTVGAIIEKDGKILLVRETKEIAKGQWNIPSGWISVGENPFEAVKREVKEETGYDFEPEYILRIYSFYHKDFNKNFNITPHAIRIIFVGKISNNFEKFTDEISETKWFSPEEIYQMDKKTLRALDIKQMVKDYFADKKYPLELLTHIVSE